MAGFTSRGAQIQTRLASEELGPGPGYRRMSAHFSIARVSVDPAFLRQFE
jgi:hypothetical protein